jgi:DnaK suppressor protein
VTHRRTTPPPPRWIRGSCSSANRDHLREQLGELTGGAFDDNFADSGQVAAEQGENRVLAGRLRDQLDDVERALARIDNGTYGECEICGSPIGEVRLEIMPAARHCINHAG